MGHDLCDTDDDVMDKERSHGALGCDLVTATSVRFLCAEDRGIGLLSTHTATREAAGVLEQAVFLDRMDVSHR